MPVKITFTLRFRAYGQSFHWIVQNSLWNINAIENGDSLIWFRGFWERKARSFKQYSEEGNAYDKALHIVPFLSNTTQRLNWCEIGSTQVRLSIGSFSPLNCPKRRVE